MPILSSEPSISVHHLQPHDQFIIFASDGLWEHLSNQEAVDIVQNSPRSVRYTYLNFTMLDCVISLAVTLRLIIFWIILDRSRMTKQDISMTEYLYLFTHEIFSNPWFENDLVAFYLTL